MSDRTIPPSPAPSHLTRIILALVVATTCLLSAASATAQVSWRMTTEYPENNISGIGLVTFAKLVSEHTKGQVTVTP
jgi:TRAP-type C4-dicarboxylate transport system substrate-binding protein